MSRHFILTGIFFVLTAFSAAALNPAPSAIPGKYADKIESVSIQYGLNPRFVQALIWRESRFNAYAKGKSGEIGLMQVRMSTVRDWAKAHHRPTPSAASVYDVDLNLHIGIWRLDQALKHWEGHPEQINLALFEYNAGRTALLRRLAHCEGDVSLLLRTHKSGGYAAQILEKYGEYSRLDEQALDLAQF